jgi:hypothetical protein
MQTSRSNGYAGSRLNRSNGLGRHRRKGQPWSRTGENPPSGILGGMEETSASFEARYAPPSYPTTSFPAVSRQRGTSILPRDHGVAAADRDACFHSLAPLSFDKSCPHALPSHHAYLPILRPVAQVLA